MGTSLGLQDPIISLASCSSLSLHCKAVCSLHFTQTIPTTARCIEWFLLIPITHRFLLPLELHIHPFLPSILLLPTVYLLFPQFPHPPILVPTPFLPVPPCPHSLSSHLLKSTLGVFNKVFIYLFIYLFIYFSPILSSHSYSLCFYHLHFQFLSPIL